MWRLSMAIVIFIVFSPMAYGDLYWTNLVESVTNPDFLPKNLPKQVREQMLKEFEPTTETEKCYLTPYGFRTEAKDHIVIFEYDSISRFRSWVQTLSTFVLVPASVNS